MFTITFAVIRAMATSRAWFQGRFDSDRGASAVEYALLVGLIAAVVAGAVLLLGGDVKNIFNNTASCISQTSSSTTTACGS